MFNDYSEVDPLWPVFRCVSICSLVRATFEHPGPRGLDHPDGTLNEAIEDIERHIGLGDHVIRRMA